MMPVPALADESTAAELAAELPARASPGISRVPSLRPGVLLTILAGHVVLGLLMHQYRVIGTFHAWGTLLIGVVWAINGRSIHRIAYLVAYVAGAEVLWRMTNAGVVWEFGKYATALILLLAIQFVRVRRRPSPALLCFALLVPSVLLTVSGSTLERIRHDVSFNMSGPLALAVAIAFFARVRLSREQLQWLIVWSLAPIMATLAVAISGVSSLKILQSVTESASSMTGGFGPNQVSTILGFGALIAFAAATIFLQRRQRILRWCMIAIAIALAGYSAITLSRSGIYLATGSGLVASLTLLRDRRSRLILLSTVGIVFLIGTYVVFPFLDSATGGALSRRFSDTGLTGRDVIMRSDLRIWWEHPLLGVGPGRAAAERVGVMGRGAAAHTEFTRLLAEHGLLGAAAMLAVVSALWRRFRLTHTPRFRALILALFTFSALYMTTTGMRTVLPAFALGLAFSRFDE